jgi:RNA polymerase sigma factor (TIGR02999 family)
MSVSHRTTPPGDVTRLLHHASGGDRAAYDRLFALAHGELQGVAARQLRRDGAARSIDPAELVSELYLKLSGQLQGQWSDRAHFYGVAARAMRQILVDLARRQQAAKRGGGDWHPTTLTGKQLPGDVALEEVLALDAVLEQLAPRQRQVVELRFFAGASEQEIADVLGTSTRTVQREWTKARAWLYRALYAGDAVGSHDDAAG